MAVTFTQARTVAVGDPVGAGDMASLAQAVNTRLTSGVGDFAWRVAYYVFAGLFRKVRNDNGSLATPEAEFFNAYQMLNPGDAEWPLSGAGDPEGANLANHLNVFVHGSEALDMASERARIASVPTDIPGRDTSEAIEPWQLWELGKYQRGAYDPTSGAYSSPMFTLGVSYGYIRGGLTSPHGTAWGGYFPRPENISTTTACAAIGDYYPPNLVYKFTNLTTAEVVTYTGSCPETINSTTVAGVSYTPFAYIVFTTDGGVTYYAKSEWIEGPYTTDAQLSKSNANAISRAVTQFVAEFRGDETQRAETDLGQGHAFRLEEFLTEQFPLAPQIGVESGDSIAPIYPAFYVSGTAGLTVTAGNLGCNLGGSSLAFPAGAVGTHFLARATGLASNPVTLTIKESGTTVSTVTLSPDPSGNVSQIVTLPSDTTFASLTVETSAFVFLSAAGQVYAEFNAMLPYKPQLHDYYAITRLASYIGSGSLDGSGTTESQSKEIYDGIRANACITSLNGGANFAGIEVPTNQNAVFDAARRLSQCVRILPRHQLLGYAVEGGKSILWLRRYAFGMSHDVTIDLLEGIGPSASAISSGSLVEGRTYNITSGSIVYNREQLNSPKSFTATSLLTYEGSGTVMESDGIREAEPKGYSNKWCVDFRTKPYYWSDSSIWKPESYADVFSPFVDRCTFDSPEIGYDNGALLHVAFGVRPVYEAETPSGYRYMDTPLSSFGDYSNVGSSNDFCKSCRVYEPPLDVESAVLDSAWGTDVVKLTLTGRVHYHEDAPASISSDITTWVTADIDAEVSTGANPYRTTENALREYLIYDQTGKNAGVATVGDKAFNSTFTDAFGSVFPSLIFVKLIPEPYLDGNTTLQKSHDSPALSDHLRLVELYLRAGCEGFVDGRTSGDMACENSTTTLFDYTWENLCFDAFANRYVPLLPTDIREDNPYGHGPMPMTKFYAGTYNNLSAAVNKLTTARLMLPASLEYRITTNTATVDVTSEVKNAAGDLAASTTFSSSGASSYAVWLNTAARGVVTPSVGSWIAGTSASIGSLVTLTSDGSTATLTSTDESIVWRWAPDPAFEYALPDTIAAYVENPGVLLETQTSVFDSARTLVAGSTTGSQCHSSGGPDTGWYDGVSQSNLFTETETVGDTECRTSLSGAIASGEAPRGDVSVIDGVSSPADPDCFSQVGRTVAVSSITNTPAIIIPTVAYSDGD